MVVFLDSSGALLDRAWGKGLSLVSRPHSTLAYLSVVLVPGTEADPKVTFYNATDATHAGLRLYSFLIDTGADHSLLRPDRHPLLARSGSFPGVQCSGIAGGWLFRS